MRKFTIFLLVAALFVATMPVNSMAYTSGGSSGGDVCAQAKNDASMDAGNNKWVWMAAGCFLSVWGILIAYVVAPSVPSTRVMGKSSEYVTNYTMCYQDTARSEQSMSAVWGCVVGTVVGLIAYVVYAVALTSAVVSTAY